MANQKIIKIFEPEIILDEISIDDSEFGTNESGTRDHKYQLSKSYGFHSPIVVINGMTFAEEMISMLVIRITNFLPRIEVMLKEQGGIFTSMHFPKDGDLISVYIRSTNSDYKTTIRNDYKILNVDAPTSKDSQGESNTFSISGQLHVPGLYSEDCFAFEQATTFDSLQKMAKRLNLGFASNESLTNDVQNWLCPFDTDLKFINDMTLRSYKDDKSFYTAYIDQYYYLNFVEVNNLFVLNKELETIFTTFNDDEDYLDTQAELEKQEIYFMLSNDNSMKGTPQFINGYTPIHNAGEISLKNAYRRYLQTYDRDTRQFLEYFLETMNTDGSEDKVLLKGRINEDHTLFTKFKYMGQLAKANVHENYHHAAIQNFVNNVEVKKLGIKVELPSVNPTIHMHQIIPVFIINKGNQARKDATESTEEREQDKAGTTDQVWSGFYIVTGMEYVYMNSTNKFLQRITLHKREWDNPIKSPLSDNG